MHHRMSVVLLKVLKLNEDLWKLAVPKPDRQPDPFSVEHVRIPLRSVKRSHAIVSMPISNCQSAMTARFLSYQSVVEHHVEPCDGSKTDQPLHTAQWAHCVAVVCNSLSNHFWQISGVFRQIQNRHCVAVMCSKHDLWVPLRGIYQRYQCFEKCWCPEEDSNLHALSSAAT